MTVVPERASGKVRRLITIRNRYEPELSAEKLRLLKELAGSAASTPSDLQQLHSVLCFIRAFPDSMRHHALAIRLLNTFHKRVCRLPARTRRTLDDSGIAGTRLFYTFSYYVALWLARRCPGRVTIDWPELANVERLDELLALVLHGSEDEYFDSGWVAGHEWLEIARGDVGDFDWLMAQLRRPALARAWAPAYDAANLPLCWQLGDARSSRTRNVYPVTRVATRQAGMRRRPRSSRQAILQPLTALERLPRRDGARMIDVAMASLGVRHRETWHFNHANPYEVYVADVGEGVSIAVFGLLPGFRFPLECTMGYLILANGVPVGYGGSSLLFRQVNTGVNLFDEYRGSEAAYLWVQVMRVYHQLTGCTRYIANPYQFGEGNDEALKSGAFWFYYRIGYRPVDAAVRKLAAAEWQRLSGDRHRRSKVRTLRRLARCDLQFTLPGARAGDLFDERWIETSSLLATRELANAPGRSRDESARRLAQRVARDVGIEDLRSWTLDQRRGLERIAPFVAAATPDTWPVAARRTMQELLRAKGASTELGFARAMCGHAQFLQSLRIACRRAERKSL